MKLWNLVAGAALVLTPFMSSGETAAPSFDCAKAQSSAEEAVCANPDLAMLDVETARLYRLALSGVSGARADELKAMQRGWIKGRDECWKSSLGLNTCIAAEYALRIFDLRTGYASSRAEEGASTGPKVLDCDSFDAAIGVVFINASSPMVALKWRDVAIALPQVPSGSGAKYESNVYADGPTSLFTKGDEALFTPPGGTQLTCRIEEIG